LGHAAIQQSVVQRRWWTDRGESVVGGGRCSVGGNPESGDVEVAEVPDRGRYRSQLGRASDRPGQLIPGTIPDAEADGAPSDAFAGSGENACVGGVVLHD
jgi:hypothetical protein